MSKRVNKELLGFARRYCAVTGENIAEVYQKVAKAKDIHKAGGTDKSNMFLLDIWKKSNRTDYSVYSHPEYVVDAWLSWDIYSKDYTSKIARKSAELKELAPDIKTFVDLGAGIGYSTLSLANTFNDAKMIATQVPDTWQWSFCEKLFKGTDISIMRNEDLTEADAIFASEYFEHFDRPIDHLNEILAFKPKLLLIKSTFQQPDAIGHFEHYYDGEGRKVAGRDMNRVFNKYLRDNGYTQNPIRFFNSAPTVFVRND